MQLSGKRVLVTGAGGFIGRRLCERLIEDRGARVVASDLRPVEPIGGGETLALDVTDERATTRALDGVDAVFHCAAMVTDIGDYDDFIRVNHGGALNVFKAALRAGTERVVFLSSVLTMGVRAPDGANEDTPMVECGFGYADGKMRAERSALALHRSRGLPVVIIRPANVYGPASQPWVVRPYRMAQAGMLAVFGGGQGPANHVHVDNLIDGMLLATERDESVGRRYVLSDDAHTTWYEYFSRVNGLAGRRTLRRVPIPAGLALAWVMEQRHRISGVEPLFTRNAVLFASGEGRYDVRRAREELGYRPRIGLEEGMQGVEAWLRDGGAAD